MAHQHPGVDDGFQLSPSIWPYRRHPGGPPARRAAEPDDLWHRIPSTSTATTAPGGTRDG